jgi:hypothetical protein
MKKDFVPKRNNDLGPWMERFVNKLPEYEALLNLAPGQVAGIETKVDTCRQLATEAHQAKNTAKGKVRAMQTGQTDTVRAIRRLVRQIKASPGYSTPVGHSLGIIGPEDSAAQDAPVLRISLMAGNPLIRYRKGRYDGIYLYCSRGHEEGYTLLATDTRSPYLDKRANLVPGQPEERRYKAIYMKDDMAVGVYSNQTDILV